MKPTTLCLTAALTLYLCIVGSAAAETTKDYALLEQAQPASDSGIQVLEFFAYDCAKCYRLSQAISQWYPTAGGDVELIRIPVVFDDAMKPAARLYYGLQALGRADKLHGEIYNNVQMRNLQLEDVLVDATGRQSFSRGLALDPEKFAESWDAADTEQRLKDSETIQQRYQVSAIPTLVVDGKYKIAGLTEDRSMQVLKDVVQLVRAGRSVAAPDTAMPVVTTDEPRPAKRDVTHCLEFGSYQEIAKCTGEL